MIPACAARVWELLVSVAQCFGVLPLPRPIDAIHEPLPDLTQVELDLLRLAVLARRGRGGATPFRFDEAKIFTARARLEGLRLIDDNGLATEAGLERLARRERR